ncbi:MAG: hypothetical protein R3C59_09795 [Planctomycetaceae bacterium]
MNQVIHSTLTGVGDFFESPADFVLKFVRDSGRHFEEAAVARHGEADAALGHRLAPLHFVGSERKAIQSLELKQLELRGASVGAPLPQVFNRAGES